jgi:polyphosphate kinase
LSGDFYIGSADWMDRNLSRRIEAVTPVVVRTLRERLWEVLQVQLEDQRNAWQMQSDGSYIRLHAEEGASEVAREGTHMTFMKRTRVRLRR